MDDQERADYDRLLSVSNNCDLIKDVVSLAVSRPEKMETYARAMIMLADEMLKVLHRLQTEPVDD